MPDQKRNSDSGSVFVNANPANQSIGCGWSSPPSLKDDARPLWPEAKELHLIFAAIHRGKKDE